MRMQMSSLRSRVGMVFQKPNPFPKSIYDNIAYGLEFTPRSRLPTKSLIKSWKTPQASRTWKEVATGYRRRVPGCQEVSSSDFASLEL